MTKSPERLQERDMPQTHFDFQPFKIDHSVLDHFGFVSFFGHTHVQKRGECDIHNFPIWRFPSIVGVPPKTSSISSPFRWCPRRPRSASTALVVLVVWSSRSGMIFVVSKPSKIGVLVNYGAHGDVIFCWFNGD